VANALISGERESTSVASRTCVDDARVYVCTGTCGSGGITGDAGAVVAVLAVAECVGTALSALTETEVLEADAAADVITAAGMSGENGGSGMVEM
jgi:hypothetical protein